MPLPRRAVRLSLPLLSLALLIGAFPSALRAATTQFGFGVGRGNQPGSDAAIQQVPYDAGPERYRSMGAPPARAAAAPDLPLRVTATYFVTTAADTGSGSLRAAITAANASPGLDAIHFLIMPGNLQTIAPTSQLPDITDPVVIDGTTQPGYSGTPIIELSGAAAGPNAIGLVVKGGNSTIRGLVVNRWATTGSGGFGIVLDAGSNNVVEGNYIGIDPTGLIARPNAVNGIAIFGTSTANVIGGTTPQARNVISGNTSSGIQIVTGNAGGNFIRGNYIGLNAFGLAGPGNGGNGVFVNAPGNTIGGTLPGAGNVISGNALPGIFIGQTAGGTVVQGNFIGTDASGLADVGNLQNGIYVDRAPNNVIGDSTGVARNVISGNQFPAVYVFGAAATGNRIQGNFLCVDRTGGGALGDGNGIVIDAASGTRVGGTTAGARNVIGGTPNVGIAVVNGATSNRIIGNYIGTDSSGTAAVANLKGILINNSPGNFIGGNSPGERNVISGNTQFGVEMRNPGATATRVFGNHIGTDPSGTLNVGNGWHGVVFALNASADSVIGNVIAYNNGAGVYDSSGTNNVIRRNSIFSNTARGIDLFPAGLSPNDSLDADAGANDLQNFPVLDSASVSGGQTHVYGTFNSRPNRVYVLEFFANDAADPSHFGEGQTYLGSRVVQTDAGGNVFLGVHLPAVALDQFLTVTATDSLSGVTSEFSQALCLNDSDGDGLWDCWETQDWGIDVNSDGVIDLDLFARGARPDRKDLFVEVDAMAGKAPPAQSLQKVQLAFATLPSSIVPNPSGVGGIALHAALDDTNIPVQNLPSMWEDFDAVKTAYFGTAADRADANRRFILQSKRLVYRYGLWGRTFCAGDDTLAGGVGELMEGEGGDDFLITLGSQGACGWRDTVEVNFMAGVFMHELGHTLGLMHGGGDHAQLKPNYYSVMNYAWSTPSPRWQAPGAWRLDYSRADLPDLDESSLDETGGLGVPAGIWPIVTMPYRDANHVLRQARLEAGAPVDWSGDGTITSNVSADLNILGFGMMRCDSTVDDEESPDETLTGHFDWGNLKYNFRNSPAWLNVPTRCGAVPPLALHGVVDPPIAEPTRAEIEAIAALTAPRPEGQFTMDGQLDVTARLLDSNAGLNLYAAYRSGQLYVATGAAPAAGGDLVIYLSSSPDTLRGTPFGKAGAAGAWKACLSNTAGDNATDWADESGAWFSSVAVDTATGLAEGVVDIGLLFGRHPEALYLAAGKYAATPGGALIAQVPAGNGDGNLDGAEYLEFLPGAVSVTPPPAGPRLRLAPVHPNPVAGRVRSALTLREPTDVDVTIQDVSGRRVATIVRGRLAAGTHPLEWIPGSSGRRAAAGVYFMVVRALGRTEASRIVLVK